MSQKDFRPITGTVMPRFAGVATFMRLPYLSIDDPQIKNVEVGLVGVPWDGGTTNRAGARHGPRQLRDLSTLARNVNRASGINPFELCNCADLGDSPVNPVHLDATLQHVEEFFTELHTRGITPLATGGDQKLGRRGRGGDTDLLSELSYLLESGSDRIGALDFQRSPRDYLPRSAANVPLEELLQSAARVEQGVPLTPELDQALFYGSSIGGARPKALIEDNGKKYIAKFSSSTDLYSVV